MPHTTLTALAAKLTGRPVKLVVGRDQMFTVGSFRPETRHEVILAADLDGGLQAYRHIEDHSTSQDDEVVNAGTPTTARMYGYASLEGIERVVRRDTNTPGFMRAPNEVPAFFALESAVDELAWKLGIDPVELRLRNDTMHDPVSGVPFSSRSLVQCFRRGAELFGWNARLPEIGAMREGGDLVGYGCATATYPTHISPAVPASSSPATAPRTSRWQPPTSAPAPTRSRPRSRPSAWACPTKAVSVELGDSAHPTGPVAGGSQTSSGLVSAITVACEALRHKLAAHGAAEGRPLAEAVREAPGGVVEAEGAWKHDEHPSGAFSKFDQSGTVMLGPVTKTHAMYAFGAEFVEVRVNPRTGVVRVPRMVGVFAAGRILNPRTARSQLLGGMIWGLSSALHEETEVDPKRGHYVNANIAEYLIPVSADIGEITVETLEETDSFVNPLGVKGIGELGIVGTAAAIANAVYHACGVRVRELPIRMEKVLAGLGKA